MTHEVVTFLMNECSYKLEKERKRLKIWPLFKAVYPFCDQVREYQISQDLQKRPSEVCVYEEHQYE